MIQPAARSLGRALSAAALIGLAACGDGGKAPSADAGKTGGGQTADTGAPNGGDAGPSPTAQQGVQAMQQWCRFADPGFVEAKRLDGHLSQDQVAQIACPVPAVQSESMKDEDFRPAELVLPMPCGQKMVFRKVTVPVKHWLDHRQIYVGEPRSGLGDPVMNSTIGVWPAEISGNFPEHKGDKLEMSYYVAKYETSAVAWSMRDALSTRAAESADDPACRKTAEFVAGLSGASVLPQTNVSWFEAVDYSRLYTEWLYAQEKSRRGQHMAPILPRFGSALAFVRLPTEVEWEYAARGGRADDRADAALLTYDVDGQTKAPSIGEIAYVADEQNRGAAGAQVAYSGRLLPNKYGLYDMVGNADEMVLDPFQPTRPDTLLARWGGLVLKGGNAGDPISVVGPGYRRERHPYDIETGEAFKGPRTGFRMIVTITSFANTVDRSGREVLGNSDLDGELRNAETELNRQDNTAGGQQRMIAIGTVQSIKDAVKAVNNPTISADIATLEANLVAANTAVAERERQVLRESIYSTVLLSQNIVTTDRLLRQAKLSYDEVAKMEGVDPKDLADVKSKMDVISRSLDADVIAYGAAIGDIAAKPTEWSDASGDVGQRIQQRGQADLLENKRTLLGKHVQEAIQAGGSPSMTDMQRWHTDIVGHN